jgi:type I restriction enzyme S subunit
MSDAITIGELKPYPEYKDSEVPWLGMVPKHWKVQRAKFLFKSEKKLNFDGVEKNILSLTLRGVVNNDPKNPEGLVPKDYATYQIFERGDLVFKLIDLENLRTSRVGLVHERGIMSPAYIRLESINNGHIDFFYRQFYDLYLRGIYNQLGAGVRSTLGQKDLLNIPILVPVKTEQILISNYLNYIEKTLHRTIYYKRKMLDLLNEQRQIIINLNLMQGTNPNVSIRLSEKKEIEEICNGWISIKLKHVSQVQTGITLGKKYLGENLIEYPYLRVANVQDGYLDLKKIKTIRIPRSESVNRTLQYGDVLMTEGGDIDKLGRGYIWEGKIQNCLHQNHIYAVRVDKKRVLPQFLVALMTSYYGRHYFQKTAKQTTNLASTNSTILKTFPLFLPNLEEQRKILANIDKETSDLVIGIRKGHHEIDLIQEYRTRIISDVITGKVDVRNLGIPGGSEGNGKAMGTVND